jgi:hypothetical protein
MTQAACQPVTPGGDAVPVGEKIKRIENGLFPRFGFPPWKRASLRERMAHYNVPGVGIAIIEDYNIRWAKGYGVTEAGGHTPFQARDISRTASYLLTMHLVEKGMFGGSRRYYDLSGEGEDLSCSLRFDYRGGQGVVIMMNGAYDYSLEREILHSVFTQNHWRWGRFTLGRTIFKGMLLVIAIAVFAAIVPLAILFLFLRGRKNRRRRSNN